MQFQARKIGACVAVLAALAQFAVSQPAIACDMHGDFGFNRLNPFLAMRHRAMETPIPNLDDSALTEEDSDRETVTRPDTDAQEVQAADRNNAVSNPDDAKKEAESAAKKGTGQS
ncbi:hypothetical protein [Alterisphingorhabdus coralli]|uniref:Uncharacterized protein n=1 Tax=Alterisphingorhabdus coralli TaxID=3071408 RepID=A0AA97F3Y4_9SPHN|nr:hypothetical protein [Parasphingorhabdus sp. SCSIO 66989]WOE73874.1 hypothetical protein RB602_08330 [Parasphingorhabdus sp. SCSIO 66989]